WPRRGATSVTDSPSWLASSLGLRHPPRAAPPLGPSTTLFRSFPASPHCAPRMTTELPMLILAFVAMPRRGATSVTDSPSWLASSPGLRHPACGPRRDGMPFKAFHQVPARPPCAPRMTTELPMLILAFVAMPRRGATSVTEFALHRGRNRLQP